MKNKNKLIDAAVIFVLVILCVGVFFFIKSNIDFAKANYKVKFFPMMLSALLVVLCIAEFVREYREKKKENEKDQEVESGESAKKKDENYKKVLLGFMWLAFIPVSAWLFGFYVTIPAFSFLFLRSKKTSWKTTIIITVIMFCVVFFLFGMLLRMNLYPGIIYSRIVRGF